jgi:hypothetical protein
MKFIDCKMRMPIKIICGSTMPNRPKIGDIGIIQGIYDGYIGVQIVGLDGGFLCAPEHIEPHSVDDVEVFLDVIRKQPKNPKPDLDFDFVTSNPVSLRY